jgi:hypothetical protein
MGDPEGTPEGTYPLYQKSRLATFQKAYRTRRAAPATRQVHFLERRQREVRKMPGSVTEPIQERHRPFTLLADNARKPLGEVEDPLRLHNTSGGILC